VLYSCAFCPFSRKVRFFLDENCVGYENKEVKYWERGKDLLKLNPASETPILKNIETNEVICDSFLICKYVTQHDIIGVYVAQRDISGIVVSPNYFDLMATDMLDEYEIQRLHMWFDKKFFNEVTSYIIDEMFLNTFRKSGKTTNMDKIMVALDNFEKHINYIEFLLTKRKYLGGESFSIADIAATAQISILDYLSLVDWEKHSKFKDWYISIKQKIGFRRILEDKIFGFEPNALYNKLDF
jgi:glutathione S-transferase